MGFGDFLSNVVSFPAQVIKEPKKIFTSDPIATSLGTDSASLLLDPGGFVTGGVGPVKDLLWGKKAADKPADEIAKDVRRVQLKGLLTQEEALKNLQAEKLDPTQIASEQITAGRRAIMSGAEDQRRKMQQAIAQRGLGRSSLGLTTAMGLDKARQEKIERLESMRPRIEREAQQRRTDRLLGAGSKVLASQNAPIQFRDIEGQRGGGISGILGGVLGGVYGGPGGAMAGFNIGQGLGGIGNAPY